MKRGEGIRRMIIQRTVLTGLLVGGIALVAWGAQQVSHVAEMREAIETGQSIAPEAVATTSDEISFEADAPVAADSESNMAGLIYAPDPEAVDLEALRTQMGDMLSRSSEGLTPIRSADGSVVVHLDGRFLNAAVAVPGEDGELVMTHASSVEETAELLGASDDATTDDER